MNEPGARRLIHVLIYVLLLLAVLISLFPFYWMFVIGSQTTAAVNQFPPVMISGSRFLLNAENVLERIRFFRGLLNSLVVSGSITLSVLFFSSLAGFAFAKLKFYGRTFLFVFIVATMMIPMQLGLIPQYMIISHFGWLDSFKAVIVPAMVSAFGVFWMRQYIASAIPDELMEAGRIDGCSNFRLYAGIVLPAIRPALATLGIVTFMQQWNDFLWPLVVLKDQRVHTIQIMLRLLNDAYYTDYAMVLAGTFMATLPILIIFLIFSKQFIAGITEGAVKH